MAKTTLNLSDTTVNAFISGAPLQEKKENESPKKERKNKIISITLRQSDLEAMDNFCEDTGMSRSNLVRMAVKKYMEEYYRK